MNINQDNTSPLIKFTPRKDEFSGRSSDMGTRPASDPKSAKSFKKIMDKGQSNKRTDDEIKALSDGEEEELISRANEMEEVAKKTTLRKGSPSLFDLSGSKTANPAVRQDPPPFLAQADDKPKTDSLEEPNGQGVDSMQGKPAKPDAFDTHPAKPESPSSVFAKMSAREARNVQAHADQPIVAEQPVKIDNGKQNFTSRFATEQPDLSYVNPMALAAQPAGDVHLMAEKPTMPVSHIQDIINQMAEKIAQMKDQGRTETVITLKHPPHFAGATLVITGFDSAKKEFNIAFENLTQAAKEILDLRANQNSLKLALEEKGYAIHIITTTTEAETRPSIDAAQQSQSDANREGRRGEGRQKRQRSSDQTG